MAKRINKTHINFWLDAFMLVNFLALCVVSVVVRYVFPSPSTTEGWTLWGLDYLAWTDIQFVTLCVLFGAILLHLMLHWSWICGVVTNWYRKRTGATPTSKEDTGIRTI
ncbi:MAG: DUF4405 domain-containing protein, partial [Lacipirellulaceae bacterium]